MMKKANSFLVPAPQGLLLEYRIKPIDIITQTLKITLVCKNLPQTEFFTLYQGDLKPYNLYCCGLQGQALSYQLFLGQIQITSNGVAALEFQYVIEIGQLAKHGHQGRLTPEFLICSGENILLLPLSLACSSTDKEVRNSIAAISLIFAVPEEWNSLIPFSDPLLPLNAKTIQLNNPCWSDIYQLLRSCYSFGNFKAYVSSQNPELTIYTPQTTSHLDPLQVYIGIRCLYQYYAGLLGIKPKLTLILLEPDKWDRNYIFGGESTKTIGTTFQPDVGRDWELLAHRLFHVFFDSIVTSSHFHRIPQLWFYEGLATYYENVALDALPHALKLRLGLDAQNNFSIIFQRYLYFRLKEPQLLALAPMNEEQISSGGMIEFLHYTQAPLLVKLLEDTCFSKINEQDSILRYILKYHTQDLTVQQILCGVLEKNTVRKMQRYLYSSALLPLWHLKPVNSEDAQSVCQRLNNYSFTLWSWFRLDGIDFPPNHIGQSSYKETSPPGSLIEQQVQQFSPYIYKLLKT